VAKPWQYYIIAPIGVVDQLRILAESYGDGGAAELNNFNIPLTTIADPSTIVAYGGSTGPVGDYTASVIESMYAAGTIPSSVMWAKTVNESPPARLVKSSLPAVQAQIDTPGTVLLWDLPTALSDAGLAIYVPPGGP